MKPLLLALLIAFPTTLQATPLTTCASNPRYFCRDGAPVLLVGSHTWPNLYDRGTPFDFTGYLDFLQAKNHNFIRLWAQETTICVNCAGAPGTVAVGPEFPWLRPGPGLANDGLPKFDLTQPNPAFYQRLRSRVVAACERDFYVDVMFFEGLMLVNDSKAPWTSHPFHPANNVNGIDGGHLTYHTLNNPAVTALQIAYIHNVIDATNDLDCVLYEISNESLASVSDNYWQNALISEVKTYEQTLPKQHPVGMTCQCGDGDWSDDPLWASLADWISPGWFLDYKNNPPVATGAKVVITDTDHLWGEGGDAVWVWKCFLRGCNPIFMDRAPFLNDWRESARNAMGHVRAYNADLLTQVPQNYLASSGYCLCSADKYATLAFLTGKGKKAAAKVTVTMQQGAYTAFWVNPSNGQTFNGGTFNHGGGARSFTAPQDATMVLLLSK